MSHEKGTKSYQYFSSSATVHTIVHSLNDSTPVVIVIDEATNSYIIPQQILIVDANTVEITLYSALAIRGKVL
jgi:hypothetical protein